MQTLKEPQVDLRQSRRISTLVPNDLLIGYVLLFISFSAFVITEMANLENKEGLFTIFVLHYLLALAYTIVLIFYKSFGVIKSWKPENLSKTVVSLLLYLVSAYALNRELPVFQDSTTWLCVYLIVSSLVLMSFHFEGMLPKWARAIQFVALGSALLFYAYLAVYVASYYILGFIGILVLGIGAHIFVPIFLIIGMVCLLRKVSNRKDFVWLGVGVATSVLYCVSFMAEWNNRVTKIDQIVRESVMYPDAELPLWVRLGEVLPNDWITERILKTDLVYTSAEHSNEWFSMPRGSWVETKKHDPFVILGTMTSKTSLSQEHRINILRSISDTRHRSHERLWSGDNLVTSNIVTDVDVYRHLHLAYTEKYLDIRNTSSGNAWWGNTEEALYTFRMPEGSVVTSLSLWINGKEEKAILTSKGKATEAYETIVGRERRDPSVVHWQEGNTVLVRVFPCSPTEERKVKIGFTTPLLEEDGELIYKNITFEGPSAATARETIRVRMIGEGVNELAGFQLDKNNDWVAEDDYNPDFEVRLPVGRLKTSDRFNFLDHSYHLEAYHPIYAPETFQNIFLDINNTWTRSEIEACKKFLGQKNIYVYYNDSYIQVKEDNWHIVDQAKARNYSLFPIHKLKDASQTLVVTKGTMVSPHLGDLKGSAFASSMGRFFAKGHRVRVFNFGTDNSNFIQSLRELRALHYASGNVINLTEIIEENKFPVDQENENQVVLHEASLKLVKQPLTEKSLTSTGPDHLYRLFAYNAIMRQAGPFYFAKEDPKGLVEDAARAYVVSPFSSLIVLESQADYDRFGIQDVDHSLKNAAKQSSGAVPEPHEWALIVLAALVAMYVRFKR